MDTLFRIRAGLVAGVMIAGCGESVQTSGNGPFDARDYRTIRVSHLDDSRRDWVEVPEADPADAGEFREIDLSTFGTEELLSGATAAMRTVASRILFDEAKGIGRYFAEGFEGPSLSAGSSQRLAREDFLPTFREYLVGFDRIRDLGFKELSVTRGAGEEIYLQLDLKLTILGSTGSAMRRAVLRFPAVVAPVAGYWRFLSWGEVTIDDTRGTEIHFLERTKEVGLRSDFEDRVRIPGDNIGALLYVNGGLVVTDTDGDGDLDIYVTRRGPNFHFKNDGRGRFSDVAKANGTADEGHGHGAVFVELDGDGALDLFVANNALTTPEFPTTVLWNTGGSYTADGNLGRVPGYATAIAVADHDNDGDLDVFLGRYGDATTPHSYSAARGAPADLLYRNNGGRRFRDTAAAAGIHNTGWTLAATWGDYDVDGAQDLYISNDFGTNELYHNRGDGTFEEVASKLGAADLGNGMGANWVDHDADGDFDLYSVNMYSTAGKRVLTSQLEQLSSETIAGLKKMAAGNTMLRNDGGSFQDVSNDVGCQNAGWAWGTEFFDYDSDGDLDMLIANGYWSSKRQRDL